MAGLGCTGAGPRFSPTCTKGGLSRDLFSVVTALVVCRTAGGGAAQDIWGSPARGPWRGKGQATGVERDLNSPTRRARCGVQNGI